MRHLTSLLFLIVACPGCSDSSPRSNSVATPSPDSPASGSAAENTRSEPSAATTEATSTTDTDHVMTESSVSAATGRFRGVVTFNGQLPPPIVIQATKDQEVCAAGERELQHVVVNDGFLAGAVVEISVRGKDLPDFQPPPNGFVIRQKDCLFHPPLLVAYSGAEIVVHNDDQVPHNVNTGQWNLLQAPGAEPLRQQITYGGTSFTRVTCNIHNWMESWVYVARSPFYAASNEKGEFVIEGIPPGKKMRGTITHATLGRQRFTVEIAADETTEQNFEFEAK